MSILAKAVVLALVGSSASTVLLPRATAPPGWLSDLLEDYDTYHTRYLALGCNLKHNTAFFDQCCHPLLATERLSSRPAQCTPATVTSAAPSVNPTSHSAPQEDPEEDDDDLPYCDSLDEAEAVHYSTATSSTTVTVTPTHTKPAVTSGFVTSRRPSTTVATTVVKQAAVVPTAETNVALTAQRQAAVNSGGFATYYYQNGVAGACGTVHSDNDLIGAMDGRRYGDLGAHSSWCGKKVTITNTKNGKSVTITIADACPTCENSNSIDLSKEAFQRIAPLSDGMVPITWYEA